MAAPKRWRPRIEPRSRTCQPLLPCGRSRCQALYADILEALGLLYNYFCHVAVVVGGRPCLAGLPVINRLSYTAAALLLAPRASLPVIQIDPPSVSTSRAQRRLLPLVASLRFLWLQRPLRGVAPLPWDWMRAWRFMTLPNWPVTQPQHSF